MFVQFNDALSFGVESNGQGTSLTLSLFLHSLQAASTNNFLLSIFLSADHRTWLERSNQARGVLGWGCYQEESESSNVFLGSYLIRYSLSKMWLRRRAAINPI